MQIRMVSMIPGSWSYFPDLTTATGSGNNDSDGLSNLQEQSAGTDPTLSDTDGDMLDDDDEINVHGTESSLGGHGR